MTPVNGRFSPQAALGPALTPGNLAWHCKNSLPLLTSKPLAHRAIKRKIIDTPGVILHQIGGTETHVHVAVTIPPTVAISDFAGQVKGASSHEVNMELGTRDKTLQWQAGYGVVSFGTRDLPWVRRYIARQPEHHASGRVYDRLERIGDGVPRQEEPPQGG